MVTANNLNSSLNLTSLDFFGLKNSFKNYMQGQELFKDYDFDGSTLSVLLDELAYNTYKNAFMTNMLFSEGFIDSAQLRGSLFSHSKELNYLPRSSRSAKALVSISFTALGTNQPYIIEKGAQLSTLIKSSAYTFSVPETIIVTSANNSFNFTTEIYEGAYKKDSYIFQVQDTTNPVFKITNPNVDTTSISVLVFEDGLQTGDYYTLTDTLLDLTQYSKAFFLQTSETGNYEIYFGDNVLGRQPKLNSTIIIDYRISSGTAGNGAKLFSVDFDPTGVNELITTPTIVTIEASNNGDDPETNDSIRYYAPRAFQVQQRCVTASDYEVSLKQQFPEISSVSVYGGELVSPPQYGRVFVAVDIAGVDGIPDSKKIEYTNFLQSRASLSVVPILVEPEFMYLAIKSLVRYNLNVTTNSTNRINTLVTQAVIDYNTSNLNDFGVTLRLSHLTNQIDTCDPSIVSNITTATAYKKTSPIRGVLQNLEVDFNIAIQNNLPTKANQFSTTEQKSVYSDLFQFNGASCLLEDDGAGNINLVKYTQTELNKLVTIGSVDYTNGIIKLQNFQVDDYTGPYLNIYAVPSDVDVAAKQNVILAIEPQSIAVSVEGLRL